ncbi:YoaK family protein [Kutzneria buriramensis]|uniref:YoaK family protein n=1 Tax=Kutzneria buriramensis TaxID=1045776 RepID=UPI0014774C72|nr:YoaK family protein [Kutzneria buriramensis]
MLLGIAGGFLDAFTFVAHGGVFANAQTGNVVLLGVAAAHGDAAGALRHVPPLIAFVLGVAAAETLTHPRVAPLMRRPIRVALVIEIAVLLVVGAIPTWFAGSAVVLAVAFVAALQNATFGTVREWSVNTTMTTGNLRTAARATYRAVFRRDAEAATQARAFGLVVLSFLVGAGVGALVAELVGNMAAWGAALLIVTGLGLFFLDERPPG